MSDKPKLKTAFLFLVELDGPGNGAKIYVEASSIPDALEKAERFVIEQKWGDFKVVMVESISNYFIRNDVGFGENGPAPGFW